MESIYQQLKKKALPFVKAYHNDILVHDKAFLRKNPTIPFLHFTGETGTHLVGLYPPTLDYFPKSGEYVHYLFGMATREKILDSEIDIINTMMYRFGRNDLALHFDGKFLHEITYSEASRIADEYKENVIRYWRENG